MDVIKNEEVLFQEKHKMIHLSMILEIQDKVMVVEIHQLQ